MASEIPSWQTDPLAWDQIKINGRIVPGRAQVRYKVSPSIDVRKPPKMNHAVLVEQGEPPIDGEIELEFGFESAPGSPFGTAAGQIKEWFLMEAELFGRKSKTRKAYVVSHPEFTRKGISKIYLGAPGSLQGSGPGKRSVVMNWWQFDKVYPSSTGEVQAGPTKPLTAVKSTDIRTLANAKKPSTSNTGP